MDGYTKLFKSILASTIWNADDKIRIVWITLLAMADRRGVAEGSIPGLATIARVSLEDCEHALNALKSPDIYSRSKVDEGRRIKEIDGGWLIINHSNYRAKMGADERREYKRQKAAEYRRKNKRRGVDTHATLVDKNGQSRHKAEAEADTEAKADRSLFVDPANSKIEMKRAPDLRARAENSTEPVFRPPNGNPHGDPSKLINGHAMRTHGTHPWCSLPREGLCVTQYLHREFIGKSLKPEAELLAWYPTVLARYADTPVGDDPMVFWRNEFAQWCGLVTAKPTHQRRRLTVAEVMGES